MRLSQLYLPHRLPLPVSSEPVAPGVASLVEAGYLSIFPTPSSPKQIFLPLGMRVLHRMARIFRQEMNRAGALEALAPAEVPLWEAALPLCDPSKESAARTFYQIRDRKESNLDAVLFECVSVHPSTQTLPLGDAALGQVFEHIARRLHLKTLSAPVLRGTKEEPPVVVSAQVNLSELLVSIATRSCGNRLLWPLSIAPFHVMVQAEEPNDQALAQRIQEELLIKSVDALLFDGSAPFQSNHEESQRLGIPIGVRVRSGDVTIEQITSADPAPSKTLHRVSLSEAATQTAALVQRELEGHRGAH